jgi:hypothetical protein
MIIVEGVAFKGGGIGKIGKLLSLDLTFFI